MIEPAGARESDSKMTTHQTYVRNQITPSTEHRDIIINSCHSFLQKLRNDTTARPHDKKGPPNKKELSETARLQDKKRTARKILSHQYTIKKSTTKNQQPTTNN